MRLYFGPSLTPIAKLTEWSYHQEAVFQATFPLLNSQDMEDYKVVLKATNKYFVCPMDYTIDQPLAIKNKNSTRRISFEFSADEIIAAMNYFRNPIKEVNSRQIRLYEFVVRKDDGEFINPSNYPITKLRGF